MINIFETHFHKNTKIQNGIYIKKTGLQHVSKPVQQVHYFGGGVGYYRICSGSCMTHKVKTTTQLKISGITVNSF